MERGSGILLPIFSLPGRFGIGTLGENAYAFARFLYDAGQKYWQVLPLTPTGMGDSPYASCTTFGGNTEYIDFDLLIEDGLLDEDEVKDAIEESTDTVDHASNNKREKVLRIAAKRGLAEALSDFSAFKSENEWLDPYCRFLVLKKKNENKSLDKWEIFELDDSDKEEYDIIAFCQYLFFKQWSELKAYVNSLGIKIIGDLPIYVTYDSAEVYSEPWQFKLNSDNLPVEVSGVPPDYFSEDGQLWGNPLYDYDHMREDGYSWWIRRIGAVSKLFDVIRIDHFRGLASYWSIPSGETSAKNGKWVKGPGMDLLGRLTSWFSDTQFIAEDLGVFTPDVYELLDESGLPGMHVLQFGFDGDNNNTHLPHTYKRNSICYSGTHDNDTTLGWLQKADDKEMKAIKAYMGLNEKEGLVKGVLRTGMASISDVFIAPMQDYLELDSSSRMNVPGTANGNWKWRMKEDALSEELAKEISELTMRFGR